MSTCRQIHIVSLPYSKTRPGLDAHITKRTAILLLLDIVATYAAYWLASLLTDVEGEVFVNNEIYFMLGILALINVAVLGLFHLYNNLWEYASVDEAIQIVLAVVLSTLVGAVFLWIIDVRLPIRVFFVSCFMLIFFMGGIRLIFRVMRQKRRALVSTQRACDRPRTLVVGAGETGSLAIGRMASKDPLMPGIPIVATDDDPTKRGSRIHGVRVAGSTDDIVDLVDKHNIDQIVVAIPSSTPEERKRIYGECTKTDCKLRTLPNVRELSLDEIGDVRLRDVDARCRATSPARPCWSRAAAAPSAASCAASCARWRPPASSSSTCTRTTPTCCATSFWPNTTTSTSSSRSATSATRRA